MPRTYTNKFNRGEVDENVMARDDVERVHDSCSLMENFMPKRVGVMQYRPGTEYLGDAKVNGSHFLMPFVDDGSTPTVLEFSQSTANPSVETVRFWIDGALATVTATTDTISNGEFTGSLTGWTDDDSGTGASTHASGTDRLKLTGGTSAGDWARRYQTVSTTAGERTIKVVVDDTPVLLQIGTSGSQSNDIFEDYLGFGEHLLTFTADGSNTTFTLSNSKPYSAYVSQLTYVSAGTMELTGSMCTDTSTTAATLQTLRYTQVNDVMFITDNAYDTTGYSWPFWIIKRRGTKSWSFELPDVTDGPFGAINDTSLSLQPSATTGDATLTSSSSFFDTNKSVGRLYRLLHGGTYGICQVVSVTSATVANVRVLSAFGGVTAVTDWWEGLFARYLPTPTSAEVFNGRLWLAGGARLYGSVSDLYTSFDEDLEGDSAAITKTIGFGPVQDVAWLIGGDVLMMGLSSEEVQVRSNADLDVLTASNTKVARGSNKGSGVVKPQVVDQIIYFVNRSLKKLFALSGLKGERITAADTTILHPDILSPGVKKIVYSSEPEPRMYCLLTDGTVRVLLFDEVEEVTAWSRIALGGGGTVEDMTAVPTGDEDEVYMVVERNSTRYIERMAKFSEAIGGSDSRHYDSHVYKTSPGGTFTGLSHLEGLNVRVWADGVEKQQGTVSGGSLALSKSSWTDVVVGLRHTATWTSNKLSRYVQESVLNYRKRVKQIGLVMRAVALRTFKYGPNASTLSDMPDIDEGRPRAPTTETEPTIVDQIDGATDGPITVQGMEIVNNHLLCACDTVASAIATTRDQFMAYYDGDIYIAGGVEGGGTSAQFWKYNIASGVSTQLTDLPAATFRHAVTEHDGVIYVTSTTAGNYLMAYDVASASWLSITQPGSALLNECAMAAYDGKLYIYGGEVSGTPQTKFESYDIAGDSWSTPSTSGTIEAKKQHCAAAPQSGVGAGKIYFFGGLTGSGTTDSNNHYEYDVATATFSALANTGMTAKQYSKLEATNDGKLWNWGGKPRVGTTNYDLGLYSYNISGDSWTTVYTITDGGDTEPHGRTQFGMAWDSVNDRLYIYGGTQFTAGNLPDLWYWDIDGSDWVKAQDALGAFAGALRVVGISDPSNLVNAAALNLTATGGSGDDLRAYQVRAEGSYAFLVVREDDDGTLNRGLASVDISSPASPTQTGYLQGGTNTATIGSALVVNGNYAYVQSFSSNGTLSVVDISAPASMSEVDTLALTFTTNPVNTERAEKYGNHLYFPWENDLHIINITDPLNISDTVFDLTPLTNVKHCAVDQEWLYVIDAGSGVLQVYNFNGNPTSPTLVGSLTNSNLVGVTDLLAFSPWVYLVTATEGHVVDVRDPANPVYYVGYTDFAGLQALASRSPNVLFAGSDSGQGKVYAADQRSWQYVDYDEMSFEFNGTYDTDSRVTLQATGPATVLALTYEIEDVDAPTDGSDRSD